MRSIELPERETVKLVFGSEHGLSEQDYLAFCRANPDLRCERTAEGEIVIVPPAGLEGAYRSMKASSSWIAGWNAPALARPSTQAWSFCFPTARRFLRMPPGFRTSRSRA